MVSKFCCTSHGQPCCGSRSAAMMRSKSSMPCSAMTCRAKHCRPVDGGIAAGEEIRIEQGFLGVVAQRLAIQLQDPAPGLLEHALPGRGVPFAGRAVADVQVRLGARGAAELKRRAERTEL